MIARDLHSWQLAPAQAIEKQRYLASLVARIDESDDIRFIAGVDISRPDKDGVSRAACVVLLYPSLEPVEIRSIEHKVTYPYIPGLLSFRECPPILDVCEKLNLSPDLILVDGQGIAHPRRLGLASHLGLLWDKPTIGCAKSRLCGHHSPVPAEQGSYCDIEDKGEIIGAAVRSKERVKPLYVSIGHKIALPSAIKWVLNCCRGFRIPEPLRLAHLVAGGQCITGTSTGTLDSHS